MDPTYLGMKIRSLRLQDDVAQSQLAAALGVGKSTVSMWESGNRTPDLETLEAIADYFNVSIASFFPNFTPPEDSKEAADDLGSLSGYEREVILMLRRLSEDQQQSFLQFLKSLLDTQKP